MDFGGGLPGVAGPVGPEVQIDPQLPRRVEPGPDPPGSAVASGGAGAGPVAGPIGSKELFAEAGGGRSGDTPSQAPEIPSAIKICARSIMNR